MIRTLSPYLEQGRIRIFCVNSVNNDSFQNKGAHPFHRSWMQAKYDAYVANEVFPFIDSQCQTPGIGIATLGASLGAYHAANTLFKHPDHVKRCYALSGIYDMRDSMDGMCMTTTSTSITRSTIWPTRTIPGFFSSWRVVTSTSRPAVARGKCPGRLTACPRYSRAAAYLII